MNTNTIEEVLSSLTVCVEPKKKFLIHNMNLLISKIA